MMLCRTAKRQVAACHTTLLALLWMAGSGCAVDMWAQRAPRPAKSRAAKPDAGGVPVLMLSDIHFEPFQDPAKLGSLVAAPVEQWPAILGAPASPTQAMDFQALGKACPVHGVDTGWPLLAASLSQESAQLPRPVFVTVSGDLLSHAFECRFRTLAAHGSEEDLSAFAAKTVAFVAFELRHTFPNSPVYLALGNNDTGCNDYREDRNSAFLQHVAETFAAAAGAGDNGQTILREFSDQGDYSIVLPAPLQQARLIVLQDIFESAHFADCAGRPRLEAEAAQLAWLSAQLAEARTHREHVWVMAHVPPGVDMYSTLSQRRAVCSGQSPVMFLRSEKLVDVLTAHPDVIALAIFAHTHADELRFLHAPGSDTGIPVKLVGSISPVNGNRPTFTVAEVNPRNAEMLDYTVYFSGETAGTQTPGALATGLQATGSVPAREYSFRDTYKLPSFSASGLQTLTHAFLADGPGTSAASRAYQRLYFPGDSGFHATAMTLFWHTYACSLAEDKPDAFRACSCPASTKPVD